MRLITNIKLECALFEVRMVLVRDQLEEFSFRFESIVRGHCVYKGALNKNILITESNQRLTANMRL